MIANAGVSGDTTSGGLSRLDWSVPDGTQLVILELGANDMLRGIAPEITEKNLAAMIARLKERNIPVLLAGMRAAPNLGPDYQAEFNAIFPRLAEKYGVPLYPFFLDGVAAEPRPICSRTACIRTPRASTGWWNGCCPTSKGHRRKPGPFMAQQSLIESRETEASRRLRYGIDMSGVQLRIIRLPLR